MFVTKFLSLFLLFFTWQLSAASMLLQYNYGNEQTKSELTVYSDGWGELSETKAGKKEESSFRVSKSKIKELRNDIETAMVGPVEKTEGRPITKGSPAGFLVGNSPGTSQIILISIRRTEPTPTNKDTVYLNHSPATSRLREIVEKVVANKIGDYFKAFEEEEN